LTDTFLIPKPKNLSYVEAASMPLSSLTALQAFEKVKCGIEGKAVLITAGRKYPDAKIKKWNLLRLSYNI
jgi:NADPH:quinone reductase-like Zn-dependent oxidoreductase